MAVPGQTRDRWRRYHQTGRYGPSYQVPRHGPAKPRCVGTFQNGQFTLRATSGGGIYGDSFSCGGQDNYVMAERLRNAIRFYVAGNIATIKPGQTVAIGGYDIKVRLIKGSTAVFEVTPR